MDRALSESSLLQCSQCTALPDGKHLGSIPYRDDVVVVDVAASRKTRSAHSIQPRTDFSADQVGRWGMHFSPSFSSSTFSLQNLHFAHIICGGLLDAHTHSQGRYIIARGRTHTQHTHNIRTHTHVPGSHLGVPSHGLPHHETVVQSQPNTATIITTRKGK